MPFDAPVISTSSFCHDATFIVLSRGVFDDILATAATSRLLIISDHDNKQSDRANNSGMRRHINAPVIKNELV